MLFHAVKIEKWDNSGAVHSFSAQSHPVSNSHSHALPFHPRWATKKERKKDVSYLLYLRTLIHPGTDSALSVKRQQNLDFDDSRAFRQCSWMHTVRNYWVPFSVHWPSHLSPFLLFTLKQTNGRQRTLSANSACRKWRRKNVRSLFCAMYP